MGLAIVVLYLHVELSDSALVATRTASMIKIFVNLTFIEYNIFEVTQTKFVQIREIEELGAEETNQCGQSVIVVGGCSKDQVIEVEASSYLETPIFTQHIEEGSLVGLDPSEKYKIAREHLHSNIILFLPVIFHPIYLCQI